MLDEVIDACSQSRTEGPFQAPVECGFQSIAPRSQPGFEQLLPIPKGPRYGALAFSVCQEGSDGRHNDAIQANDKPPPHDCMDAYVSLIRKFAEFSERCIDLGSEHVGRLPSISHPVPSSCILVACVALGISDLSAAAWVLTFGAAATVWHFKMLEPTCLKRAFQRVRQSGRLCERCYRS